MLEAGQDLRFPGSSVSVGSSGTHTERVLARDVAFLLWQMRNTCPLCYSFVETFIRTSLVPRTGASPFLCSYLPKEEQQRERAPPSGHQHLLCTAHLSCKLQSCLLFWEDGSEYTNTELFCLSSTQVSFIGEARAQVVYACYRQLRHHHTYKCQAWFKALHLY